MTMRDKEEILYDDFSDEELAEELISLDEQIQIWQGSIARVRKNLNSAMNRREEVLNIIAQRAGKKGWK